MLLFIAPVVISTDTVPVTAAPAALTKPAAGRSTCALEPASTMVPPVAADVLLRGHFRKAAVGALCRLYLPLASLVVLTLPMLTSTLAMASPVCAQNYRNFWHVLVFRFRVGEMFGSKFFYNSCKFMTNDRGIENHVLRHRKARGKRDFVEILPIFVITGYWSAGIISTCQSYKY